MLFGQTWRRAWFTARDVGVIAREAWVRRLDAEIKLMDRVTVDNLSSAAKESIHTALGMDFGS